MAGKIVKIGILIDATDKASKVIEKYSKDTAKAWKHAGLAMAGSIAAVGSAFVAAAKHAGDYTARIARNARQIGITAEQYQELEYAAEQAGIKQEVFFDNIRQFNSVIGRAADGSTEYEKKFRQLGISLKDGRGNLKNVNTLFNELADVFKNSKNDAAEAAAAFKLFGETGARLASVLNLGKEGLQKVRNEAHRLGIILSTQTVLAGEQFTKQLEKAKRIINSLVVVIGSSLLPVVNQLLSKFAEFTTKENFAVKLTSDMKDLVSSLIEITRFVVNTWKSIELLLDGLYILISTPLNAVGEISAAAIKGIRELYKVGLDAIIGMAEKANEIAPFAVSQSEILSIKEARKEADAFFQSSIDKALSLGDSLTDGFGEFEKTLNEITEINLELNKMKAAVANGILIEFDKEGKKSIKPLDDKDKDKEKLKRLRALLRRIIEHVKNVRRVESEQAAWRAQLGQKQIDIERAQFEQRKAVLQEYAATAQQAFGAVTAGLKDIFLHGKDVNDVLKDMKNRILDVLFDAALNAFFGAILGSVGGPGGGILGAGSGVLGAIAGTLSTAPRYGARSNSAFNSPVYDRPLFPGVGTNTAGLTSTTTNNNSRTVIIQAAVPPVRGQVDDYLDLNINPGLKRLGYRPQVNRGRRI